VLKLKFQKLHLTIIGSVNPGNIINFLFQKGVVSADDMQTLWRLRDDPKQQCIELLALLHTSKNPQAFVQLYNIIKKESDLHLQWLVERVDNVDRQSTIHLLQQQYSNEATGISVCFKQ